MQCDNPKANGCGKFNLVCIAKEKMKKINDWVGSSYYQPCTQPQMCIMQIQRQIKKDVGKGMVM